MEDGYFFLDGNATLPTLYDEEGVLTSSFYNNGAVGSNINKTYVVAPEDTIKYSMNGGHNGLQEFEFTNAETGDVNVVYKRADENYAVLEPRK